MHVDNTYCHRCGERLGEREVAGRLRPSCESCGETVFLDPKVAVAVVATDDGKILMVKRAIDPMMGRWSLPAGYVDRGEVVEEAAAREVREETGVEVRLDSLLGVYSSPGAPVILIVYAATITAGVASPGDEALDVGLFGVEELPEMPFPHDDEIMRDWRRLRRYDPNSRGASQTASS